MRKHAFLAAVLTLSLLGVAHGQDSPPQGSGGGTAALGGRTITTTSPILIDGGASATLAADRTIGLGTTSQGFALIGSTTGTAAPAFRALVAGDIPDLAASKITSGQLLAARGGTGLDGSAATNGYTLIGNSSGYSLAAITGTANRVTVSLGAGTIALSGPQDVAVSSTPTFAGLTLTGQLLAPDGTAGSPSITQASDPDNGVFFGTNTVSVSAGGAERFKVSAAGATMVSGQLLLLAGSVGTPAVSFAADADSGLASGGNDVLDVSTGGVRRARWTAAGVTELGSGGGTSGNLRFNGLTSGGATIKARSAAGTPNDWTLPDTSATAGQVLTDAAGDGVLSWTTPASTPSWSSVLAVGATSGTSNPSINTGQKLLGAAELTLEATGANILALRTNSAERVRVDSTGRVGIGATPAGAAQDMLEVVGASASRILVRSNLDVAHAGLRLQSASGDLWDLVNRGESESPNHRLAFRNSSDVEAMSLTQTGTLTVGPTGAASGRLELAGATSGAVGFVASATAGSVIYTLPSADGTNGQTLATNGSAVLSWATAGGTPSYPLLAASGSAGAPSYAFTSDAGNNSGLYYTGTADTLGISTGGTLRWTLNTAALTATLPFRGANGSVSAPTYSFSGDTNTGLYQTGTADTIALATNGIARFVLNTTTLTIGDATNQLTISSPGVGGGSPEHLGVSSTAAGTDATVFGGGATGDGTQDVSIGRLAGTRTTSGGTGVCLGYNTGQGGGGGVVAGYQAVVWAGLYGIALGSDSAVGLQAGPVAHNYSMSAGFQAATSNSNQISFGGQTPGGIGVGTGFLDFAVGNGAEISAPSGTVVFRSTDATAAGGGTGMALTVRAGSSDGAAAAGATLSLTGGPATDGAGGSALIGGGTATGSNRGSNGVTVDAGNTTGNATGSLVTFKASTAGASGTGNRASANVMQMSSTSLFPTTTGVPTLGKAAKGWKGLFLDYGIDTTTGDSATISKPAGRFRKDNSGTTFTVTNTLCTANSIVVLTFVSQDATATVMSVAAAAGSFVVTFNLAPTADCDVNFVVINTD